MDDGSCAVCADTAEWVAYGPCGHRDVCGVCIARLRFVCHDRRCCICKSLSPSVFITRALGSLTRVINDFSILPADAKDGKVGSYWFHESTQAYFDDFDEYKIIKAMCRLSCSICDQLEVEGKRNSKRRGKFKSIEQLKDHLSRQHELFFCGLCLENKKVFICEQKLYSRAQLRQHIKYGNSEVDGSENERCGFSGHPFCEFCQTPFYGDNELYFHMSTEHYTCHICQRQHPTRCEYYKDYNDLECHFRQAHFLCEDDVCLEKKFIVFATKADMKRHSVLEHGGNMSRSKRNTALQLSTCFHYREREEEGHRVRAHVSAPGVSNHQLSSATSVSAERTSSNLLLEDSSIVQPVPGHNGITQMSSTANSVPPSGEVQGTALDFRSVLLSSSDFPPLPRTSKRRRRKSRKSTEETGRNTASSANISRSGDPSNAVACSTSSSSVNPPSVPTLISNGIDSASSSLSSNRTRDVGASSSAPDFLGRGSLGAYAYGEPTPKGDDIQAANERLLNSIHASLEFEKDKYAAFRVVSKEYRNGEIDAGEYLAYIHQFGLAHLTMDLARLCPDPQKQKELMEIYKTHLGDINENGPKRESGKKSGNKNSKKGKEKCEDSGSSGKGEGLPESLVNHFRELKLNAKPHKGEEPSSSKGVEHQHPAKGKTRAPVFTEPPAIPSLESHNEDASHSNGGSLNHSSGAASTRGKKKTKKKPKFLKTRLGESSESVVPDLNCSYLASDMRLVRPDQDSILAAVCGVWRNGGGRRLVAMSQASPLTR